MTEEKTWRVVNADCVEYLKTLPENSVDSCVCDPPYGLEFMGKEWDSLGDTHQPFKGELSPTSTGPASRMPVRFQGQNVSMQGWHLRWAIEVFRVLKPGGHLLAFGGTRTYHRLACAVEDAGFDIRDTIDWVYSTGFPKSLDTSLAIDDHFGVGELRGRMETTGGMAKGTGASLKFAGSDGTQPCRTPITNEAKGWVGWGTALKPAHEPIVVARKPLIGTVAENVLKYGTGAINVDATRVSLGGEENPSTSRRKGNISSLNDGNNLFRGDGGRSVEKYREERPSEQLGRWPSNLVLTHSPKCRRTGTAEVPMAVRSSISVEPCGGIYGGGNGLGVSGRKTGEDMVETIETYACTPDCPVAELDRQSGESVQYERVLHDRTAPRGDGDFGMRGGDRHIPYTDSGGASRFFPTFSWHTEEVSFIYEPKASRSEREAGLDGTPARDVHFMATSGGAGDAPSTGNERFTVEVANHHPTVKPIALLRWLVRLVTPPGGLVLDPFAGSGSTGCAAVVEGMKFVGIEKEKEYVDIAEHRIQYWQKQPIYAAPISPLQKKPEDEIAEGTGTMSDVW